MTFLSFPDKTVGQRYALVEYSGAWTKFIPIEVTAADRLNGIQLQGMTILGGAARRDIHYELKEWSEWKDVEHQKLPDSARQYYWGPNFIKRFVLFVMEKRNNQWSFKVPHGNSIGGIDLSEAIDLDALAASKKACGELLADKVPKTATIAGPDPQRATTQLIPFAATAPDLSEVTRAAFDGSNSIARAELIEKANQREYRTNSFLRKDTSFNVLRENSGDPASKPIVIDHCRFYIWGGGNKTLAANCYIIKINARYGEEATGVIPSIILE